MKRKLLLAATGLGLAAVPAALWACADTTCQPSWKLGGTSLDCASRGFLSPGNDSRVNLLFLLRSKAGLAMQADKYPVREYYSEGYGHTFLDWQTLQIGLFPGKVTEDPYAERGDYYGSRCISLTGATSAFAAALQGNPGVPAAERDKLSAARARVKAACDGGDEAAPAWPDGIGSPAGKAFLGYLQGAEAFYAERWDDARRQFAALSGARDPWLRETAAYMAGRVELNAAQAKAFDEDGWGSGTKNIDQPAIKAAQDALAAYLKAWPQGRYADSARGLQRRALWLSGDAKALAGEYARLLGSVPAGSEQASELIQEIDNKLLFAPERTPTASGPLLLAALDLVQMRDDRYQDADGQWQGTGPALTKADLDAQAPAFAGEPELYGLLQGMHAFYVRNDPRAVLALIPDDARRAGYSPVAFSRQVLRGQALAAVRDRNEAGFWRELLAGAKDLWQRPTAELGLALSLERSGQVAQVFAKDSPITDSAIRRRLLGHSAGKDVLRLAAQDGARPQVERDTALFTLLYKQLTRGDYAGFAASTALVPVKAGTDANFWYFYDHDSVPVGLFTKGKVASGGYPCPALVVTAQALAKNPQDVAGRLCLGEFLRLNGFDDFTALDDHPGKDELGGARKDFAGQPIARGAIYASVIANAKAPANDRAYALYRMVNCYAPSGSNSCGGQEVEIDQRKAWFNQLKRDYPASPWAKKLRFYW